MIPTSSFLVLLLGSNQVISFSPKPTTVTPSSSTRLFSNANDDDNNNPSRRAFLSKATALTSSVVVANTILGGTEASYAIGGGYNKINAKLAGYGLPQMSGIADGFTPLLEVYGKDGIRTPLLVNFVHPFDWVVTLPNQDANGEDGTIQAGEYAKGDSATLYVLPNSKVDNLPEQPKSYFENAIIKSISQKGDNIYQNFKITKIEPFKGEYQNQQYAIVDFKYTLLTGAGFEVDRVGVASVTSVGGCTEVFWCASTRQRYKKTEPVLRTIANSFRVYADGLSLLVEDKNLDG